MENKKSNGFGIAAMILGIVSLLLFLAPYLGLPLAVLAVVFQGIQRKKGINSYVTAGLVLGIIGIVINLMMILLVIIGFWAYKSLTHI